MVASRNTRTEVGAAEHASSVRRDGSFNRKPKARAGGLPERAFVVKGLLASFFASSLRKSVVTAFGAVFRGCMGTSSDGSWLSRSWFSRLSSRSFFGGCTPIHPFVNPSPFTGVEVLVTSRIGVLEVVQQVLVGRVPNLQTQFAVSVVKLSVGGFRLQCLSQDRTHLLGLGGSQRRHHQETDPD